MVNKLFSNLACTLRTDAYFTTQTLMRVESGFWGVAALPRMDFDVERFGRGMTRKRSSSDPHPDLELQRVRLPPWYIRLFLYSMMILCFVMVLFWQPGENRDGAKYSAIYEVRGPASPPQPTAATPQEPLSDEDYSDVHDLHNLRPPDPAELINARLIKLNPPPTVASSSAVKCSVPAALGPETKLSLCSDKDLRLPSPELLKNFEATLKANPKAGVIDIGPCEGAFGLLAAKLGHPVLFAEPFEANIPGLVQGLKENGIATEPGQVTLLQNAVSDNFGDSAIKDSLRGSMAAIHAVRLSELLSHIQTSELIIRIRMQGFECFALGGDGPTLLGSRSVRAVFMDGLNSDGNKASCLERTHAAFTAAGMRPFQADGGGELLLHEDSWGAQPIVWRKP